MKVLIDAASPEAAFFFLEFLKGNNSNIPDP